MHLALLMLLLFRDLISTCHYSENNILFDLTNKIFDSKVDSK